MYMYSEAFLFRMVENEYQGSLKNFLLAFTRKKSLTRTEADELRKILDEKEE